MRTNDLIVPTVPISYVLLMLDIAADLGIERERLLSGIAIPPELLLRPDGRISLLQEYATLCQRALDLTGEPGLAYEFGLRATLTTHGILGYGLMSQPSLRQVFDFAQRYASILRMPAWDMRFYTEGPYAVMEGHESISHGHLRRFSCEQLLVSVSSIARQLLPADAPLELWFDHPEPDYHPRFRHRLPQARFSTGLTQVRIPSQYLDIPLKMADSVSAQLAERECERELTLLGHNRDLVNQVRALLVNQPDGYPSLDAVADSLHTTSRTLTRQLDKRGSGFRLLLEEARKRDSLNLLKDPRLTLTDIAHRLGYSTMANFARAFRCWHGDSPGGWRQQLGATEGPAPSPPARPSGVRGA
ncbi:AraC family transcriptional regulator [Stagnimonas aquatica]|uniref:AraC family transcriptional regulator n=1 Tax=Stagnimonas aquatica TaxID=2689987 RepID=A0A3N0VA57_9GAMM|nr:AraC family transcriptional regulator [Stagnimonas aquatica]ROH89660.1 AraC family transcriptional regulator [Stagnimonas aquatica]